ncbi:MAG: ABC transporter substrate-binding protein [Gammaproteobacteria bacterium]|jgi:peptide/nickel transport system substrate-binding protein|nr:ABC transporter substrate-binding protein [Pseudomonadota bacterium]MCZ6732637.1 ABC transporter substrate-binding protein [Gammaproteobacteria bacterium]
MAEQQKLERLLAQGKISRREFMTRMSALGLVVVAPSLINSPAYAANKGGHFKIGIGHGSTTDSVDPSTYLHTLTQTMGMGLYNYITKVDHKGNAGLELAKSIESTPDAATWTVKLRRGIEFHSGKSLTAEDVIASFNYHRSDESKSAAKALLKQVKEIKADGKRTVVFKLDAGNADWPYIMSDYHIGIMPSKDGKLIDPTSGVGTGGYVLKKFDAGVKVELTRNKNYWKKDHAHFDSIEMLSIKDVAARTNALTTGEIHAMDRCDLKTVHLLKRNKDIVIQQKTGTQHYSIPMITTVAPFDDNNVRLALKHAVDREALVKTVLRGYGQVGNDHPIGPAQKYFNKELPQRAYDPDKAKFYLKKAGMTSLKVDLSAADAAFAGAVDAAVLYKEHAAKAGININVVREPNDGYWSNVWMKKPWGMCYWGGRPTEDWMFSVAYSETASWNDSFWKHDRFNKILLQARAELDDGKRRQLYYEMQEIVSNEGGVLVPMYASYVYAMHKSIGHGEISANWDLDGNNALERWWFV